VQYIKMVVGLKSFFSNLSKHSLNGQL